MSPELRIATPAAPDPALPLAGKVAVVTGSGRGIGRAVAVKLASAGARVVVNDLEAEHAQSTVAAVEAVGGRALAVPGDVREEGFGERFTGAAMEAFGGLDIVVNNAGFTWDSSIQKMTDEQWETMVDVHLTASFRVLRAAAVHIRALSKAEQAEGIENFRKVVNISSIGAYGGIAGQISYSAAKAGVIGLTKTLAREWGRYRVNVNAVAFGVIETRLTAPRGATARIGEHEMTIGAPPDALAAVLEAAPLGRAGTVEEAAGSVYLLCLPESNHVSGHVLVCSGGAYV
ncbi:SDR family NAD(P)-dependent oxidoreductase [Conexibacter arvalis]|uniref:3-oxoacyl-[acyl-carrier protein] reductase n=1 Tax=Conexibacter arvalis TaxID=912552 RepID=A0A840I8N8_9ACTN|nr:SDR family oxidoreductase [Conexibacter arvalis]MBB4660514.1 3-oxoacyl-[acyl-carrier protein] reductase [Conexibacter arvalis]